MTMPLQGVYCNIYCVRACTDGWIDGWAHVMFGIVGYTYNSNVLCRIVITTRFPKLTSFFLIKKTTKKADQTIPAWRFIVLLEIVKDGLNA